MAFVPDEIAEYATKVSTWIAVAIGGSAVAFKRYIGIRRDLREDHAEARSNSAWDRVIARQDAEIARLSDIIVRVSNEADVERKARHDADSRTIRAEARTLELMQRIDGLEEQIKEMETQLAILRGLPDGLS